MQSTRKGRRRTTQLFIQKAKAGETQHSPLKRKRQPQKILNGRGDSKLSADLEDAAIFINSVNQDKNIKRAGQRDSDVAIEVKVIQDTQPSAQHSSQLPE